MTDWRVMLDTNIVSHIMRYPEKAPAFRLSGYAPDQVAISSIVLAELLFGAARIGSQRLSSQIDFVLDTVTVLPFDGEGASRYASARSQLERLGTPIGANDLLIAAHALALGVTLVTDNVREFSRVPGLRVENWLD